MLIFSLFIFLTLYGSNLVLGQYDTYDIQLTDAIEIHMKPHLERLLKPEHREQFYSDYYAHKGTLGGLSINSLLKMFSKPQADNQTCHMCGTIVSLGRSILTTKEALLGLLSNLCHDSESISARACLGLLERNAEPLVWVFNNSPLSTPEVCSIFVGHGCLGFMDHQGDNKSIFWKIPIPEKKEFKPIAVSPDDKPKKILHLTDIHLDLWYEQGSNASCNEPLCCRPTSHDLLDKGHTAGYWGEINGECDIPQSFVIDSLKHIAETHPDIDAIFWTGDNVPHDVWNTTQEINLRHIHTVSGIITVAFNGKPVFPALGNHEAHPINLYIPREVTAKDPSLNMTWLYEPLATDFWARWIGQEPQRSSFLKGGFYSKELFPNWKVIVLNTNMPQKGNFWSVFSPVDPDGQLAWLIQELESAESSGQYVSILGHIPPKHEIYDAWLHNYFRILDRYAHLITASFHGHTHDDEIVLVHNLEKKPIHVSYISGSLTTFTYLNPNYAIYEMDSRGFPLSSTVYMLDIAAANQHHKKNPSSRPEWRVEYHPVKSYNLKDMTPSSWADFINRAEDDLDLAYTYADHYHRHSEVFQRENEWNVTHVEKLIKRLRRYSPFLEMDISDDEGGDDLLF